jgi:hypothetical protein
MRHDATFEDPEILQPFVFTPHGLDFRLIANIKKLTTQHETNDAGNILHQIMQNGYCRSTGRKTSRGL